MGKLRLKSPSQVWPAAFIGLSLMATPALADWMGNYFTAVLGTTWTYEDVDSPGNFWQRSVFDLIEYEGQAAVCLGTGYADYSVVNSTGRTITVFAQTDEGVLQDFPEDFILGEFQDGSFFSFCPSGVACDSSLIRVWTELDPSLRGIYGFDPAVTNLILLASYDRNYDKNLNNLVLESHLPAGIEPPAGAVTGIEWYQWKTGMYAVLDIDAASGGFGTFYRLVDFVTAVPADGPLPSRARLHQNVPNPFNPSTRITFDLSEAGRVRLEVFDLQGRRVRVLSAGARAAGRHEVVWNGQDGQGRSLPSGTYFLHLRSGRETATRRTVLVR